MLSTAHIKEQDLKSDSKGSKLGELMFTELANLFESLKHDLDDFTLRDGVDVHIPSNPLFNLRSTRLTRQTPQDPAWSFGLEVELYGEKYQLEFFPTKQNKCVLSRDLVGYGLNAQDALSDFFSKFAKLATKDIVRISHPTELHRASVSIDVEWKNAKQVWNHRVTNVFH